jgi:ligand-binding sensor domain-containing protein/two-component sensor histidine kinase
MYLEFRFVQLSVLLLCLISGSQAQSYNFVSYADAVEECHQNIERLFFDSRERLWLGTSGGGICSFETEISEKARLDSGVFPGFFISDIAEDTIGIIWVIAENGVFAFNGHQWKQYQEGNLSNVGKLVCIGNNSIGLFDHGALFLLEEQANEVNKQKQEEFPPDVIQVFQIDQSHLALVTHLSIMIWDGQSILWEQAMPEGIRPFEIVQIGGHAKQIFIGTKKKGVYYCSGTECHQVNSLNEYTIHDIVGDQIGNLYIATEYHGLVIWNTQDLTQTEIDVAQNGHRNRVIDLAFDSKGNLWLAADGQGVLKYQEKEFQYSTTPGKMTPGISLLKVDIDDHLWTINTAGKLWKNESGNITLYSNQHSLIDKKIVDLTFLDRSKQLFLTQNGTVFINELSRDSVLAIYQLDQNIRWKSIEADYIQQIWALSSEDLYKIELTLLRTFPFVQLNHINIGRPGENRIEQIHVDKKNRVWWYSENQIGYYLNGQFIAMNAPRFFKKVSSWHEDEQGHLWIGTSASGLYYIDLYQHDLAVQIMQLPPRLNWPEILNILVEDEKLFFTTKNQLLQCVVDRGGQKIITWEEIGNVSTLGQIEFQPQTLVKNRFEQLFVGTKAGVLQFNLGDKEIHTDDFPPAVSFEKVEIDFQNIYDTPYGNQLMAWNHQKSSIRFKPNQNDLHFYFSAPTISSGDDFIYRWRLLGSDQQWSPGTKSTDVYFSNLSPGEYTFEVKTCFKGGNCSDQLASFEFYIQSPIYMRPWFLIALGCALFASILIAIARKNKSVQRQNLEVQERLKLENRALDLERKALQLQMNPHFIFNAMNTIQSEIKTESISEAKSHLAKFSRLMRQVLELSRQNTVSLEDEIEMLENYISIACLSKGLNIELKLNVDERLDPGEIEIPSMILQPFIENALEHGFKGLEDGTLEIDFSLKGKNLIVSIIDDGLGIDQATQNEHQSVALKVIEERLSMMERPGFFDIHLKNPHEPRRKGTEVQIKLPLEEENKYGN